MCLLDSAVKRRDYLINYAKRFVSHHDAEDVVHDLLCKLCSRTFEADNDEAWLNISVRNLCWDLKKRGKRLVFDEELMKTGVQEDTNLDRYYAVQLMNYLEAEFEMMSKEYRDALKLQVYEGMGHEEISRTLGIPKGTAKSRLSRAKKQITEGFSDE